MATYIIKRRMYSVNPMKSTLSDVAIEFGVNFPEEMKKLSKMETRIEAKLHHWATTAPGINMVAPPEMIYQSLAEGNRVIPALVDSQGQVSLMYNVDSGKYIYGDTELDDPSAFPNIVVSELDKAMNQYSGMAQSPEVSSGNAEVAKQYLTYYTTYKDNVMMAFGMSDPQQMAQGQQQMQ